MLLRLEYCSLSLALALTSDSSLRRDKTSDLSDLISA